MTDALGLTLLAIAVTGVAVTGATALGYWLAGRRLYRMDVRRR